MLKEQKRKLKHINLLFHNYFLLFSLIRIRDKANKVANSLCKKTIPKLIFVWTKNRDKKFVNVQHSKSAFKIDDKCLKKTFSLRIFWILRYLTAQSQTDEPRVNLPILKHCSVYVQQR